MDVHPSHEFLKTQKPPVLLSDAEIALFLAGIPSLEDTVLRRIETAAQRTRWERFLEKHGRS